MWYVAFYVIAVGFGWWWNKGFGKIAPKPNVETVPHWMVNVFVGLAIVLETIELLK